MSVLNNYIGEWAKFCFGSKGKNSLICIIGNEVDFELHAFVYFLKLGKRRPSHKWLL